MDLLAAVDDFSQREDIETDHEKIELLVLTCNQEAMKYLREGNLGLSLDLLRKAEKVLSEEYIRSPNETIYKLIGVTLNNLGCYYKKTNKPKVALTYLKKALQIEVGTLQDNLNIASTHLNICAIYSSLMQHNDAIKHVKMALDLLETERNNYMLSIAAIENNKDKELEEDADTKYKSIITTTIMAYFNYGVELEHIKDLANCLKALTKGFELANRELGPDHSLTENIRVTIQKLVEKKKIMDAKTQKREEYMMRVLEMNRSMAGHPEKLEEFPAKEKNVRKSTSVQRSYGKPSASKPKQKSVRKSDRSMEYNSEIHNTYVAQNNMSALPEIKKPPKRETKPPIRARRQGSLDNNDESKGRIANNNSIGLPKIPSKEATSPSSKPERTRFNLKNNVYQKKPPLRGKSERQPLETEIQNLDSQISKLQGEILQIDDGDSIKGGHRSMQMQETPSQREYDAGLERAIYESAKVNPMEFGSRILESESSRILLNASGFENSHIDQPRQRGSRSPEDDFKYQDDVKTRFLKHRYFVPKKNIPPVQLKKNLYSHGEDSGYRDISMTSSKRSLDNHAFSKGKKMVSNRQSIEELGDENHRSQPYKHKTDVNPGQEKIHAYMQYFD